MPKAFRVVVPAAREDDAVAVLWELGTSGVEVRPGSNGQVSLLAYFAEETDGATLEAPLRPLDPTLVSAEEVPDVDWVARFREGFGTFRAGSFEVVPAWEMGGRNHADRGVLVVDPGRAFGTGTHETTRLCLGAIEEALATGSGARVLDLGTGTGLLGVAALKRGAALAIGVDNDPEAVAAARAHAALNRVPLLVVQGDLGRPFRPASFDLVLANLMAPLLRERRSEISALRARRAPLVLSGLLEADVAEIEADYAHLGPALVRRDGGWAALVFGGGPEAPR
jgi:ribosomal protein L11 methyltransferase